MAETSVGVVAAVSARHVVQVRAERHKVGLVTRDLRRTKYYFIPLDEHVGENIEDLHRVQREGLKASHEVLHFIADMLDLRSADSTSEEIQVELLTHYLRRTKCCLDSLEKLLEENVEDFLRVQREVKGQP